MWHCLVILTACVMITLTFSYNFNALNYYFFTFLNWNLVQIKPIEYMEMISSMKPNLWASLAYEVPTWFSIKRNKASVDQTVRWYDECIKLSLVSVVYLYFLWH